MNARIAHHDAAGGFAGDGARRRGMTLLEVLLALGLMAVLLTSVYGFYVNTMRAREVASEETEQTQLARVILRRIATDIRQATGYTPGYGIGLTGDHYSITIYRTTMLEPDVYDEHDPDIDAADLPAAKSDLRKIEYYLIWDSENQDANGDPLCHGLMRTELRTLNQIIVYDDQSQAGDLPGKAASEFSLDQSDNGLLPDADETQEEVNEPEGMEHELVAQEIKYLEFMYFDGAEWAEEWHGGNDQENALPQAVMITIGRIPDPPEDQEFNIDTLKTMDQEQREENEKLHPDRYQMIVRLPQADRFLTSRMVNARSQMQDVEEGLGTSMDSFKNSLRGSGFGGGGP